MRWSKLAKAMSLSLALAATALVVPQLAEPANAGAVVVGFNEGDIVKLKTFWGNGFVLNFGETAGSKIQGLQARVHWNFSWDHPNRFRVVGAAQNEAGFHWYMLVNRHSNLCLTARIVADFATVTQENCSPTNPNQRWAGEWWPNFSTAWIRNLAYHRANKNMIVSQQLFETVGSPIWMRTNLDDRSRQEWEVQTCIWSGVEQKDC